MCAFRIGDPSIRRSRADPIGRSSGPLADSALPAITVGNRHDPSRPPIVGVGTRQRRPDGPQIATAALRRYFRSNDGLANTFVHICGQLGQRSDVSNPTTTPTTVELWIRSFAPTSAGPTQERALDRLDDLESKTPIESVEVGVWGKEVEIDRPERAVGIPQLQRIESRLEAFETWAARTGRQLEPFFRNTRIESSITGESYDVWRLPTIAVAEFDGDDLLHVAPCRNGGRTIDVVDRLESLLDGAESPLAVDEGSSDGVTDRSSDRATEYGQHRADVGSSRSD